MNQRKETLLDRGIDEWSKEELFDTAVRLTAELEAVREALRKQQDRLAMLREEIESNVMPMRYHQNEN